MTLRDGKVYELMVDYFGDEEDLISYGLYSTTGAAELGMSELIRKHGVPLGGYTIEPRTVR